MTDHTNDQEKIIDQVADSIRAQRMDEDQQQQAIERVWKRLEAEQGFQRPLSTCSDFQTEIPAFIEGKLSDARALLVGDHTRECVPCRRVLLQLRSGETSVKTPAEASIRRFNLRTFSRIAAAFVLLAGGWLTVRVVGDQIADRNLRASIQGVDGSLQLVSAASNQSLEPGNGVVSHQILRTAKDSGAFLRLADGSIVEMDERSELQLRASRSGTTVDLRRGNIIVHAAKQHGGRLFVATKECRVAVRGTIFAVDHGLKGSRVSVLEGEVEVRQGSSSSLLQPGDQINTGKRLRAVPLEEEFSWSRDAETHRELVRELNLLRKAVVDAVDHAPPRTSTRLLELSPENTLAYVAMPNITDGLEEARAAFEERLAASEILTDWWQQQVVNAGIEDEIDALLDRMQPIGEAIGAEAVVTIPASMSQNHGSPLFLAELDDPGTFRSLLEAEIERANQETGETCSVALVSDPRIESAEGAEVIFWINDDLLAATGDIDTLRALAARIDGSGTGLFIETDLYHRLAETYSGGVSWLLGVDVAGIFADALSDLPPEEALILENLGLLNATSLIIERHRDGEWYSTSADLGFDGPRKGIASWLAGPAPMGSLEFVSPNAYVAVAAVTKDGADMFDDLLAALPVGEDGPLAELRALESELGINLRQDLAVVIGGEGTIALDGPMLPIPAWKLILEVYDPEILLHTLQTVISQANAELSEHDLPPVVFTNEAAGGRNYYSLSREGGAVLAVFTTNDGYLVAAPSRALVDQAIDFRSTGSNLPNSATFRDLLPDNGYSNCSALVFRDLSSLAGIVPSEMKNGPVALDLLSDGLNAGLVCVFGEEERVILQSTGGSLVGLASVLGIQGAMLADRGAAIEKSDTVSSQG